jgi:phosphoribosylanthranilate isomerase
MVNLMGQVKVKICGITSVADACLAARLGADALGLNFYEGSPRCITQDTARAILIELPPFVEPVALFVNQPLQKVFQVLKALGRIDTIQWYSTDQELCDPYPFRIIPAFQVVDRDSLHQIEQCLQQASALGRSPSAILVDAHVPGQYGGTGRCAPWDLLADFKPNVPLILAGGLTPENVAEAIRVVQPYAVDVASGVESSPGRKDPEKMKRFLNSAHEAAALLSPL